MSVSRRIRNSGAEASLLAAIAAVIVAVPRAQALPIGFGRNQGDLEFSEASDPNFNVYFDRETPEEGRLTLRALESARPYLERWIGVTRDKPLPVIVSSVTDGASFANFITDALEIQTMGQGNRALIWHEYTHAMMYRHMKNIFGPAGAVLHLPWMPVWFIEGLAEATSASVGSDYQASIERYQALTGNWPSYDRMHSLYGSAFSGRGYAVSGSFVSWLLRKDGAARLPEILQRFRDKSMPWWWPWAAVPFNGFMPMDDSLGTSGRNLFLQYQQESTARHRKLEGASAKPVAASAASQGAALLAGSFNSEAQLGVYEPKSGWLTALEKQPKGSADHRNVKSIRGDTDLQAWHHIRLGPDLVWMEQRKNVTRLCRQDHEGTGPIVCPAEARFPVSLEWLGADIAEQKIYLSRRRHSLTADQFDILSWRRGEATAAPAGLKFSAVSGIEPVSMARQGDDLMMIGAGRTHRFLIAFEAKDGACRGMNRLVDLPVKMESLGSSAVAMVFWAPGGTVVKRYQAGELRRDFPLSECRPAPGPTSPLLEAVRLSQAEAGRRVDFDEALRLAVAEPSKEGGVADHVLMDDSAVSSKIEVRDAKWRGRSVLAFPWIGADDALGPQFGFVSVPLMDHLQNETLRLSFLVGAASRYPNTDIRLISTRFKPTLSLAMFRQQTYNGMARTSPDAKVELSYQDEMGVKADSDISWRLNSTALALGIGFKRSSLAPYLGPMNVRSGLLSEFSTSLSGSTPLMSGRLGLSEGLFARVAPESLNDNFDYNALGAQLNLSWDPHVWKSMLGFGAEASRTRGKKRPQLREVYRPLKTFVPGSGGGFNKNSFGLAGEGWLFAGRYGDTQGRIRTDWTVPLVEDFEKLLWIFYVDRLDFTAFLNYGGAWNGPMPEAGQLNAAHGYNLDLQLDNKGVRFNVGGGVGQVVEKPWEVYLTVGFDALF